MDQARLERIRLLSTRFHELQGLRVALAGACIAVVVGVYLMVTPTPTGNGAMVALLLSFGPVIPAMVRLNRYYASTFGRQVWTGPKHPKRLWLFVLCYNVVGWTLNTWIPSLPAGTPTLATVALASLFVAIRDWPWRAYYIGVALAVAAAFTASASGTGWIDHPGLTLGMLFVTVGVSMVVVGVLDHLLLVKLIQDVRVKVESPRNVGSDL